MRNGKARMPNSAMAWTSSPVVTAPGRHPPGAEPEQHDGAEARQGVEARLEPGPEAPDHQPLAPQRLRLRVEALDLPILESERLDDQRALEALVGHRRHVADVGLGAGGRALDPLGVDVVQQGQAGEQPEGHQEQDRVHEGELHHRDDDDHHHAAARTAGAAWPSSSARSRRRRGRGARRSGARRASAAAPRGSGRSRARNHCTCMRRWAICPK